MTNEPWNAQAARYGRSTLKIPDHRISGYLQWVKKWIEVEGERWSDIEAALERVRERVGPFHPAALFSFWDADRSREFRLEIAAAKKARPKREVAQNLGAIISALKEAK